MDDYGRFADLSRPFARGIYDLVKAAQDESLALNKHQVARMREAVSVSVRKVCDVLVPDARAPEVSLAAARRAAELGVDLRIQTWQTQTKFDPGRAVFHYEHMKPVSGIVQMLQHLTSPDGVVQVLWHELRLAWITKDEDKRLTALGYGTKREHPDAAYAEAGIELIEVGSSESMPDEREAAVDDPWERHLALAWQALADSSLPMPPDPTDAWLESGSEFGTDEPTYAAYVAWWEPLLHLTRTGLGWLRPDLGLDHWRRIGYPPLHDPILELILRWWGPERITEFLAWSATTPAFVDLAQEASFDGNGIGYSDRWAAPLRDDNELARARLGGPLGWDSGGSDPFHLVDHCRLTERKPVGDHRRSGLTGRQYLGTQTAHLLGYFEVTAGIAQVAMDPPPTPIPLGEDMFHAFLAAVDQLESAFVSGRSMSRFISPKKADGVIMMGWYDYDDVVRDLLRAASEVCSATGHHHASPASMVHTLEGVADASTLGLLGFVERLGHVERIVDGAIAGALDSGVLATAAVRVRGMVERSGFTEKAVVEGSDR